MKSCDFISWYFCWRIWRVSCFRQSTTAYTAQRVVFTCLCYN
jgi:hypothetical protein